MKFASSLSIILFVLLSTTSFGQKTSFPENSSEFSVEFPLKPELQTLFAVGRTGRSATLVLKNCLLKAETTELTPAESSAVAAFDEEQLASAALNHGRDNGYENVSVATGEGPSGRYARMMGYKVLGGIRRTFQVMFFYGSRQVMTISTVANSAEFPTKEITTFISSLKRRP